MRPRVTGRAAGGAARCWRCGACRRRAQAHSAGRRRQRRRNEYRLGAGDVVRITVYQNPDLTLETRITEAGMVSATRCWAPSAWAA